MRRLGGLVLMVLCARVALGQSQPAPIRVSLTVTENTGGLFQSIIANALRRLQGVEVVSASERADYAWSLTVLCETGPDGVERCDNANTFAVAYEIRRPMTSSDALGFWVQGEMLLHKTTISTDYQKVRQHADSLYSSASLYSSDVASGVAHVGRQRFEQMFTDLVRKFDASCLERDRIFNRLFAEKKWAEVSAATANLPKDFCGK